MEYVWLFFILLTMQPVLRQQMLLRARQRAIRRIERDRKSRVILLVQRQETMGFLGIPILRYIDIEDSERLLRAIELTDPEMPLDVVLHTPGGLVLASLQIASALAKHKGPVRVIVPHHAMSGGTLIALAADEILMSANAVLGPLDPQIGQFPAASILAAVERKPVSRVDDETLILADVSRKAIAQVREGIRSLLARRRTPEEASRLADLLTAGTWTHDFPLSFEKAREMGLPVRSDIPRAFLRLMELFPQPTRRQPGVEYTPAPRRQPPQGPLPPA